MVDDIPTVAAAVAGATTWQDRISLIRKVPEDFGLADQPDVYSEIAKLAYVPDLKPDFGYVHWREEYEPKAVIDAYDWAYRLTAGFRQVDVVSLAAAIVERPATLRIFRLLLGFTPQEFAACCRLISERDGLHAVGAARVKSMESGMVVKKRTAHTCATVIDAAMRRTLFPPATATVRSKLDKPDTLDGWSTVQQYATDGVPFAMYLHQRHYGGAFRQILDATSSRRGDVIEDAVQDLFKSHRVPFVRTGSHDQDEIAQRFGLSVRPAPDFALHNAGGTLQAILECKGANDGGTARDKAARFHTLRAESARLGGIPLFAVLSGLGWVRTRDALGPVVRDTDGRVFTMATLHEIMKVDPLPRLASQA